MEQEPKTEEQAPGETEGEVEPSTEEAGVAAAEAN